MSKTTESTQPAQSPLPLFLSTMTVGLETCWDGISREHFSVAIAVAVVVVAVLVRGLVGVAAVVATGSLTTLSLSLSLILSFFLLI